MEQSEENTGIAVEETIGDAAYGDGGTRQAFADAGRTLIFPEKTPPKRSRSTWRPAPSPAQPVMLPTPCGRQLGLSTEFSIRPGGLGVTCVPVRGSWRGQRPYGEPSPRGAPARAFQKSESFAEYRSPGASPGSAGALGVRQSRYFGRARPLSATPGNHGGQVLGMLQLLPQQRIDRISPRQAPHHLAQL